MAVESGVGGEEEEGRVNLSVLLIKWPGDGRDGAGRCRRHQPFDAATQGARVYSVIFLSFFLLVLFNKEELHAPCHIASVCVYVAGVRLRIGRRMVSYGNCWLFGDLSARQSPTRNRRRISFSPIRIPHPPLLIRRCFHFWWKKVGNKLDM